LKKQVVAIEKDTAENLERTLKAIVQQYNNRMIENRLTTHQVWK
jgi:hypothetical protein